MPKPIIILIALALTLACREEKKNMSTEYYVESSANAQGKTARPPADPGTTPDETGVSLAFLSPDQPLEDSETVTVEVEIVGADEDGTWSLYYATDPDAEEGYPIEEDMAVSETLIDWSTAGLEPGTYYLYAVLRNGDEVIRADAEGTLTIGGGSGTQARLRPIAVPPGVKWAW